MTFMGRRGSRRAWKVRTRRRRRMHCAQVSQEQACRPRLALVTSGHLPSIELEAATCSMTRAWRGGKGPWLSGKRACRLLPRYMADEDPYAFDTQAGPRAVFERFFGTHNPYEALEGESTKRALA